MMANVQVSNLRVCGLLFMGLVAYDVFWVFFSDGIFASNVMVDVATKSSANPVSVVAENLRLPMARDLPELTLPAKILFPSPRGMSMLGLGDIVLPGLLIAYNLRYDRYSGGGGGGVTYFGLGVAGYAVSLVVAIIFSQLYVSAQPALIYLVPGTLGPTMLLASIQGKASEVWNGGWVLKKRPAALDEDTARWA